MREVVFKVQVSSESVESQTWLTSQGGHSHKFANTGSSNTIDGR